MISTEKIIFRLNIFFRNLYYHLIFWIFSLLFYVFLTGNSEIFNNFIGFLKVDSIILAVLLLSVCITVLFTFIDSVFSDRIIQFMPITLTVFLRSLMYFVVVFIIIFIVPRSPTHVFSLKGFKKIIGYFPEMDIHFIRFFLYFYLSCFFNNFFKKIVKKIGKGNFSNWFFGMLNKPREEERIFIFIDMKSSTILAEKLMHEKFSHLIQDVFNDMAVVDNYHGEIYQYLGDGAIISWDLKKGLRNNNFLKAFYAFTKVISKRERYYQRKYGLLPAFKAGMHVGKVMVLQVGRIRRDISYNGDTINTTAHIESKCNEFKQNLLISGNLYNMMTDKWEYTFKNIGNIKLKGKSKGVDIYQVKQK